LYQDNQKEEIMDILTDIYENMSELALHAVFTQNLLAKNKLDLISNIKQDINFLCNKSIKNIDINNLDICIESLHEINIELKQKLIRQNAEDAYAELSAELGCLKLHLEAMNG
jgi:hypothetical protein